VDPNQTQFNVGVIQPVDCLQEGWALIKERYWLFFGITAVGILIGAAFAIILMGPMMCGIYFCLFRRMRGETVRFEELFRGFDYFGQSVIAMLIQTIPIVVVIVPLYLVMMFGMFASMGSLNNGGDSPAAGLFAANMVMTFALLVLMMVLVNLIIGVLFMFVFPLIVDRKLSGVEALQTSLKAVWANLGSVFLLILINVVLAGVGMLLCYVGALLVLPITFAAQAVAYRKVFPEIRAV